MIPTWLIVGLSVAFLLFVIGGGILNALERNERDKL